MAIIPYTRILLPFIFITGLVLAQEYTEYADEYMQDNLYQDYASRQQEKAVGGGGPGLGKMVIGAAAGWLIGGKIHSDRTLAKLKRKYDKEQKNLYTQYYNDVYKLQEQNAELQYLVRQLQQSLKDAEKQVELDKLQRDYDEFKQPDIDGDDRISRAEFNDYVNNYLKNYPGLKESEYPKFEDFDHDHDGYVSFQEYAQQMALQIQKAEKEQQHAQKTGTGAKQASQKVDSLKGLYGQTAQTDNFNDLYANLRR
mmetsp:Transcript_49129/g.59544  ORF Transcript_49129/g.59544 Transcript_49129/m.59544 type:complete len:254 (+) Transcript_49129:134-895(+)|eukprot:CAMPEP_0172505360 /NCGR_PEP_ID=MMETSP1066-20121228/185857_1 /TAXON_ID=671091 /ORGANISM="Coscinodiscus wailesii, Strain CCMP2513" /LENGTH=253 /DNA_ID=CAMNT_0013281937 /DNA_START=133 /DNA_END=894 /DNA_ORIENTATION=+